MAKTLSTMMALGTTAPSISLPDTISGKTLNLEQLQGEEGTLVLFLCNHCPYVIHIDEILVNLCHEYASKGISTIAISSNDIENYPQDGPDKMHQKATELNYDFPYLYDESQAVAKAYDAACTPDIFLFDSKLDCYYRGQFDDSRPKNGIPVTGKDLRQAIDNLLAGSTAPDNQKPSMGCNIKWK